MSMCDVFVATGVVSSRALDVAMPGRPPFEFVRSYSTVDTALGTMGLGWRHNWEVVASIDTDPVVIRDGFKPPQDFPASECDGVAGPSVVIETQQRVRLVFPGGEILVFDRDSASGTWLLSRRSDSRANTVACLYDGTALTDIKSSAGWEAQLQYRNGHIASVSSSMRGSRLRVAYEHDVAGRLVRIRDQYGGVTTFEYENDLIVRHQRPNGVTRFFCYDHRRRCVFNWYDGGARYRHLDFSPDDRRVRMLDSAGRQDLFDLDDSGRIVRLVDNISRTTEWVFSPDGALLSKLLTDGTVAQFAAWDPSSRTKTATDLRGGTTIYHYGDNQRLATVQNCLGDKLQFKYDRHGSTTDVFGPEGAHWHYEYSRDGGVAQVRYPDGYTIDRIESSDGVTARDSIGLLGQFQFDGLGNLLEYQDAASRVTRYDYAGQDRPSVMIRPDGSTVRWEYDIDGNITSVFDALGRRTAYEYGPFAALRAIVLPDGRRIQYEFDPEDNIIAIVNTGNEVARFEYDEGYRRIRTIYFDGRTDSREYDDRNNVVALINARGERTTMEYNAAGNMTRIDYNDGGVQLLGWDGLGRLVSAEFVPATESAIPPRRSEFMYDANHHIVAEKSDNHTVQFETDGGGRHLATRDDLGRDIRFTLDARGRVVLISDGGVDYALEYTPTGEVTRVQFPGGLSQTYEFDECARLVKRTVLGRTSETLAWREYRWNGADELIRSIDWRRGETTYDYDVVGRLTSVRHLNRQQPDERYRYDNRDNLTATERLALVVADGNRTVRIGQSGVEYDAAGTRIKWLTETGTYRVELGLLDQITRLYLADELIVSCEYDLCCRRIRKITKDENVAYFYHANLLSSLVSDKWGRWDFVYCPGTYIPLAQVHEGQVYVYSTDQVGTPTELWRSDGTLIATIQAAAYGSSRAIAWHDAERVPIPFHFQGQVVDEESALLYNRFRYYDPEAACFLSQDPMGIQVGLNLYLYPRNPLVWIDPLGLDTVSILVSCVPASGPPFTACEQKALQEKMKEMNKQLSERPGKKVCTKCRSDKQVAYFEKQCKGQIPDGYHVDHVRELQIGGADLCCSNLMAIPGRPNMSSGGQIRARLAQLAPGTLVVGAGIFPGCTDAHNCNESTVGVKGKNQAPCENPDAIKEPPC